MVLTAIQKKGLHYLARMQELSISGMQSSDMPIKRQCSDFWITCLPRVIGLSWRVVSTSFSRKKYLRIVARFCEHVLECFIPFHVHMICPLVIPWYIPACYFIHDLFSCLLVEPYYLPVMYIYIYINMYKNGTMFVGIKQLHNITKKNWLMFPIFSFSKHS